MRDTSLHKPTEQTRTSVQALALAGTHQELISEIIGVAAKTLRKHYREELDWAKAQANAKVAATLYQKALSGDTTALIFWAKTQMGWRETDHTQVNVGVAVQIEGKDPLELLHSRLDAVRERQVTHGIVEADAKVLEPENAKD